MPRMLQRMRHDLSVTVATDIRGRSSRTVDPSTIPRLPTDRDTINMFARP